MVRRLTARLLIAGALAILCAPTEARADGFFMPWFGANTGDHPTASGHTFDNGHKAVGFAGGALSGGPFGFDVDFGYAPSFFGSSTEFGSNTLITLMANVIVGPDIETSGGHGVRPFVTFGVGLIRSQNDGGTVFNVKTSENDFGWNAGGGIMVFLASHVGIAGDVRYFRNVNNSSVTNTLTLAPGGFHYWRSTVGLVFR